jgi:hypothetical protein
MSNFIQALQGQSFQIRLNVAGGTGYDWCLTSMPEEAAMLSIGRDIAGILGGVCIKTFTFLALKDTQGSKEGQVEIVFKLVKLIDAKKEVAEEVVFKLSIVPYNSSTLSGFVKYSENTATFDVAPPYGYVDAGDCVIKYGYPGLKYGFPGCDAGVDACGAPVKYGYPGLKYGFPGCDAGVDACGAPVKYGYPGLKYGYPGCDAGVDACGAPVKYGYPGFKYGYPGCEDFGQDTCFKYGFPYCC